MIFWRRKNPKKEGYYLCSMDFGEGVDNRFGIMRLYFIPWKGIWIDKSRQSVFDGYKVYKTCRAPIEDNRVYTDTLCDFTDCIAKWKTLPKPMLGRKRRLKKDKVVVFEWE